MMGPRCGALLRRTEAWAAAGNTGSLGPRVSPPSPGHPPQRHGVSKWLRNSAVSCSPTSLYGLERGNKHRAPDSPPPPGTKYLCSVSVSKGRRENKVGT